VDFNSLFRPKTLAVIGVSLTHDRHPAECDLSIKNNLPAEGESLPGQRQGRDILQGETVLQPFVDIPEPVDLAVIGNPRRTGTAILEECIAARQKGP